MGIEACVPSDGAGSTWTNTGSLYVGGHTRVLKVVKTPIEHGELPEELHDKMGVL